MTEPLSHVFQIYWDHVTSCEQCRLAPGSGPIAVIAACLCKAGRKLTFQYWAWMEKPHPSPSNLT